MNPCLLAMLWGRLGFELCFYMFYKCNVFVVFAPFVLPCYRYDSEVKNDEPEEPKFTIESESDFPSLAILDGKKCASFNGNTSHNKNDIIENVQSNWRNNNKNKETPETILGSHIVIRVAKKKKKKGGGIQSQQNQQQQPPSSQQNQAIYAKTEKAC